jgi:putative tryptophan/tyrosine transport system substrate-binding protein
MRGERINEYQRLNSEDQKAFRRWLWANAVVGAILLTGLIVLASKFSGDESGANTIDWRGWPPISVITMGGELSALAAKAATSTIPIVFAVGTDPIRSGLAASLRRPDGNLTGVSTFIAEMDSKRLGLLRELRPHATTTAYLVNPKYFQAEIQVSDIQIAAQSVGQDINVLNAGTIRDIDAAFATLAQMRADALLVATDAFFFTRVTQFVVLSARHAIPTLYSRREFAAAGGLMSYGPNQDDSYRLLGVYAARILKGEKPGDLPIQLPTKFELVINLSTANALGLEVPPTLLARADEVIE